MNGARKIFSAFLVLTFLAALTSVGNPNVAAQGLARDFSISTDCTHIVIGKGKEVELDVRIANLGERDEDIILSISGPEDWEPRFEKSWAYEVQAIHLSCEEDRNSLSLRFKAKPPEEATAGDYEFTLRGTTADGQLSRSLKIVITLKAKEVAAAPTAEKVKLTTKYPSMKQPAGENFEFEIELKNGVNEARVFDLAAEIPYGWAAYCTPRWEKAKKISAIKVNANATERLSFVLIPPPDVPEGEYKVTFGARSGEDVATIELKAVVTGTYKLKLGTEAEVLGQGETRNIKAFAGREKSFTLFLWNEGSAPISDVDFFSSKPKDWEVSFKPEKLSSLPPLTEEMKPTKVNVIIKPKAKAIPGDYLVTLTASGKEDRESMELRVTVGAPMTWGWIGVAIILVVIGSLLGLFARLGRR